MADINSTRIPAPDRGMSVAVAALTTGSQRTAPVVENMMPGYDRRLPVRGPVSGPSLSTTASQKNPQVVFHEARGSTLFFDTGTTAAISGGVVGTMTGLSASTTFNLAGPTRQYANLRDYAYGMMSSVATIDPKWQTRGYGIALPSGLIRWDGTTTLPVALSAGPWAVVDLITHLDRIFVLGGTAPNNGSGNPFFENLYWSDIGGAPTNVIGEWQDDASGLTNQIALGQEGGRLYRLAHCNRNLVVIRQYAIQMLYGDTPSTFTLRTVLRNVRFNGALLEFDDSLIFSTDDGIMLYDGSQLINISTAINPILQHYWTRNQGYGPNGIIVTSMVRVGPDHILLTLATEPNGPDTPLEGITFMGHVPTQSWAKFSAHSDLFGTVWNGGPSALYAVGPSIAGWAGQKGYSLTEIHHPFFTESHASTLARVGRDYVSAGTYRYIPWQIETAIQRMGTPFHDGKITRFALDYTNRGLTAESPSGGPISIQIGVRGDRDQITNTTSLLTPYLAQGPADGSSNTPYPRVPLQLGVWDIMAEARDTQIIIAGPTGAASNSTEPKYMELGDMYLEWQPTKPR